MRACSVECGGRCRTHDVVQQRKKVLRDVDEQLSKSWQKELDQDYRDNEQEDGFHNISCECSCRGEDGTADEAIPGVTYESWFSPQSRMQKTASDLCSKGKYWEGTGFFVFVASDAMFAVPGS